MAARPAPAAGWTYDRPVWGSRSVRRWATAGLAAAALVGLAAVSLPTSERAQQPPGLPDQHVAGRADPPHGPAAGPEHQVESLLKLRADAVRNHDEKTFLSTVDPQAEPGFQQQQLKQFRNLSSVPFSEWTYRVDPAPNGASPNPSALASPADETSAPRVTLKYALAGVDVVPTSRSVGYLFARRGNNWYVTGEDTSHAQENQTWRGPWDFGPSRVTPTSSGLVLGHDGTRELARRVAQALDSSVDAVTDVWGPQWTRRVGVLLPDSHAELQEMVGPEFAVDGIAAVAVADHVDTVAKRVEGQRIVLNPKTASQLSDSALRVVLRHEITHVASRADTVDGAPMWLLEGFADYVGYRNSGLPPEQIAPDLAHEIRQSSAAATLPSDRDFHLSGHKLDLAYQRSWSLVDFLARHWGEQRVVQMYRRVAGVGSSAEVDSALRELTGMSTPEVLAAWSEELHRTLD